MNGCEAERRLDRKNRYIDNNRQQMIDEREMIDRLSIIYDKYKERDK